MEYIFKRRLCHVLGFAPVKSEPTYEEVRLARAGSYKAEVDILMSEYTRKKTFGLFKEDEEEKLLAKIEAKVAEIKSNNPYPKEE